MMSSPWRAWGLVLGLAVLGTGPSVARAQFGPPLPVPATGPVPIVHDHPGHCADCSGGPIKRALRHGWFTLKDKFIGYPEEFIEAPLGFTINEHFNTMKAKADPHDFFLYHTDFIRGTTELSPGGAQRLTLMANRLPGWLGPIVVEWTPENPDLAANRKEAILTAMNAAGIPVEAERILIGPSPYPGLIGDIAERYYPTVIQRSAAAPLNYSLPPQPVGGTTGTGGSGSSGGMSTGGLR